MDGRRGWWRRKRRGWRAPRSCEQLAGGGLVVDLLPLPRFSQTMQVEQDPPALQLANAQEEQVPLITLTHCVKSASIMTLSPLQHELTLQSAHSLGGTSPLVERTHRSELSASSAHVCQTLELPFPTEKQLRTIRRRNPHPWPRVCLSDHFRRPPLQENVCVHSWATRQDTFRRLTVACQWSSDGERPAGGRRWVGDH